MSISITTVEEVKAWLPIKLGNTNYDDKVRLLISLATTQIETALNRKLAYQTYSVQYPTIETTQIFFDFLSTTNESGVYRDARRQRIHLEGLNIDTAEPFTVWYDPSLLWTDDRKIPALSSGDSQPGYGDYTLDSVRGVLDLHIESRILPNALRVDYTAGYEIDTNTNTLAASIPDDIKMACILQVISLFNRTQPDNVGMAADRTQGNVPQGNWTNKRGLVPEASALIAHYRLLNIGSF